RTGLVDQRHRHDRADADAGDVLVDRAQVREAWIRAVVTGPIRLGRDDRLARDALVERLGLPRVRDEVLLGLESARGVRGAELVDGRVDEVDTGAFGAHQPSRLL